MEDILKEKIINNTFVDKVRNEMEIDEEEYKDLQKMLKLLAKELRIQKVVDKELALILCSMPQIIRNILLSFETHNEQVSYITNRLEDIWMDLDGLVIDCLS